MKYFIVRLVYGCNTRVKADEFFERDGYYWKRIGDKELKAYPRFEVVSYKPAVGKWNKGI